jgi:SAM-dependent methyltransferase
MKWPDEGSSTSVGLTDEVQDFYDRYPYPPPVVSLEEYRERWRDPQRRRADYHLFWPASPYREDHSILVAGCGTSQAAKHALRWPLAQITAIDFSATSVRSTNELKKKYDLTNLEIRQLPIERAEDLGTSFDQIVCTGVLHHLVDPDAGLRALHSVLKRDGAMHLMVYALYGRCGIYMLQEACRRIGIRAADGEIPDLIRALGLLPPGHPLENLLRQAPDFRNEAATIRFFGQRQPKIRTLGGASTLLFALWRSRADSTSAAAPTAFLDGPICHGGIASGHDDSP